MPETISRRFVSSIDVPNWVNWHANTIAYAKASLEFRARLWDARENSTKKALMEEADVWAKEQPRKLVR